MHRILFLVSHIYRDPNKKDNYIYIYIYILALRIYPHDNSFIAPKKDKIIHLLKKKKEEESATLLPLIGVLYGFHLSRQVAII